MDLPRPRRSGNCPPPDGRPDGPARRAADRRPLVGGGAAVTLLLAPELLPARRAAAEGGLRALADSLAADLEPLLGRELYVPPEKARLTRIGGRCPRDGTLLEFDPFERARHRCPLCG